MKILMFHGRAGGHNILPFLEYFNEHPEHELNFIYSNDRTFFPKKNRIQFTKFSFSLLKIWRCIKLIRGEYDLIWYHGGHSALIFFFFSLIRPKKSMFIFNVWNEWLINKARQPGVQSRMFRYGIRNADVIHCNWHGTARILNDTGWNSNIRVFYWGLHQDNFRITDKPQSIETFKFISHLPNNKVKFFFPKSISHNSRHDLVIDAAAKLQRIGKKNFVIYFWLGNANDQTLMRDLKQRIKDKNLEENIKFQSHGFLSFSDMQLIWKQMDVGLQIAQAEQLSTTFLEPQLYRKEIIVTNILPYQIYNQKFSSEIDLVSLNSSAIAEAIGKYLKTYKSPKEILDRRRKIVQDNFNMRINLQRILDFYNLRNMNSRMPTEHRESHIS